MLTATVTVRGPAFRVDFAVFEWIVEYGLTMASLVDENDFVIENTEKRAKPADPAGE
jgi:hypothetical protein